jgi:hypothetical protein
MFIKLTEYDSQAEQYVNEDHVIKIVSNQAGGGSIVFLTALTAHQEEPHILHVHENADEIFRMMGRMHR